jgi:LCP family protein required for cell wall assembly
MIVSRSSTASPILAGSYDPNKIDLSLLNEGDRRINILLIGVGGENHPGGNLTDTLMVASIDPKNNEVAMISVPRDLYIKVEGYGSAKINSVMSLDGKIDQSGYDLIKSTISNFLGVPIHYFMLMNFEGFQKAVDIIGGVDINVPTELYDPYFPDKYVEGYDPLYIEAGPQHMDGETALKYARSRETSSDFDRSRRQQEILMAIKDKAMQKNNLLNINKVNQIMTVLSNNIKTDIQLSEIELLMKIARNIDSSHVYSKVLDDGADNYLYADKYNDMYVLVPKDPTLKEIHLFIQQYFKDPNIVSEAARITVTNGSKNQGVGRLVSQDLVDMGYNAITVSGDAAKSYPKTFIYDYTNGGKKATLSLIKKYFDDNVPVINLDEKGSASDIEIVLGEDYKYKQ